MLKGEKKNRKKKWERKPESKVAEAITVELQFAAKWLRNSKNKKAIEIEKKINSKKGECFSQKKKVTVAFFCNIERIKK